MVCFPKKLSMVPKNWGWYPKSWSKWLWSHFLDSKNDENWSFDKMRQKVWVPLGYYFGYHPELLGTIDNFFGTHTMSAIWEKKKVVISRYLVTYLHFYDFPSPKNGHIATLGTISNVWVPSIIFLEHIPCQLSAKKNVVNISRYLLT